MSVISLLLDNGRDSKIRGKPDEDGLEQWSVCDFIATSCEKNAQYARILLSRLLDNKEYKEELQKLIKYIVFPGGNNTPTPVMTIRGLQRLLMILGGKVAAQYRAVLETTFTRVLAGDKSLVKVLEANASAVGGAQEMCRNALALDADAGGVSDDKLEEVVMGKRKMTEEEYALQLAERKQALELSKVQCEQLRSQVITTTLSNINTFCQTMTMLNPLWTDDKRLRLQVEDLTKNVMLNKNLPAITNGEAPPPTQSISISQVAMEMGVRLNHKQEMRAGLATSNAYLLRYGERPSKHRQWVQGAERDVCSYTEKDRDLIVSAIESAV